MPPLFRASGLRSWLMGLSHSVFACSPIIPSIGHGVPASIIAVKILGSWHITDTAATFIPISYSVLAFLSFSQFMSLMVDPADMPRICVCTAPEIPIVHKSEFEEFILGEIAEGGAEIIVDVDSDVVSTVLSV